MQVYTYSAARQNLRQLIDKVISDSEPALIVSLRCEVVVIGKEKYDSMINKIKGVK